MEIPLTWDAPRPTLDDPVVLASFDGWTDAGSAGTTLAAALRQQAETTRLAHVDPDLVFDFRDRRPLLDIDRGVLDDPQWPELTLEHLRTAEGRDLLLFSGGEPDFGWRGLTRVLAATAVGFGAGNYVGLGSVPGPVPHTRPVRIIHSSSDEALLERLGRPNERVVVPASFQVVLETAMRDAGLKTLGMWARVPHYVGGEYPSATIALAERLAEQIGVHVETTTLSLEAEQQRTRLDSAAEDSPEITEHIANLETWYDADADADQPIPTGDELAADFERFLRDRPEG